MHLLMVFPIKRENLLRRIIGLLFAVVLASAFVVEAAPQSGRAIVTTIKGSALHLKEGVWAPLAIGTALTAGAEVKTLGDSQVEFYLGENGPAIRILPNATLRFAKLVFEHTGIDVVVGTQLELKSGRILGSVKKGSSSSRYEVKTAAAVAGFTEALYDMTADGIIRLKKGSAVIAYLDRSGSLAMEQIQGGAKFSKDEGVMFLTNAEASSTDWNFSVLRPISPFQITPYPSITSRRSSSGAPFGPNLPLPFGSLSLPANAIFNQYGYGYYFDATYLVISPTAGRILFTIHPTNLPLVP